jgi:NADH-quinone oxidoreductase subunit M
LGPRCTGAFVALAQTDLKRMVAYTSVNDVGCVILAIAAAAAASDQRVRTLALDGAVLQMVSHGLVTGGFGALQDRAGTARRARLAICCARCPC